MYTCAEHFLHNKSYNSIIIFVLTDILQIFIAQKLTTDQEIDRTKKANIQQLYRSECNSDFCSEHEPNL